MLISNLAENFGTRADGVELLLALAMMFSGIILTMLIQKWADRTGAQQPPAANVAQANPDPFEENSMRR